VTGKFHVGGFGRRRVRTVNSLRDFTVQVWHQNKEHIVGTGFIFQPECRILTCAHVIRSASTEVEVAPGIEVRIRFHRDQIGPHCRQEYRAQVVQDFHQVYEGHYYDDVAVLELIDAPESLVRERHMAKIAPAYCPDQNCNSSGNPFRSYGYSPTDKFFVSTYADGKINGPVEAPVAVSLLADPLELSSENVGRGMSGAALLDMKRDRVVGLITHQLSIREGTPGEGRAYGADAKIVLF